MRARGARGEGARRVRRGRGSRAVSPPVELRRKRGGDDGGGGGERDKSKNRIRVRIRIRICDFGVAVRVRRRGGRSPSNAARPSHRPLSVPRLASRSRAAVDPRERARGATARSETTAVAHTRGRRRVGVAHTRAREPWWLVSHWQNPGSAALTSTSAHCLCTLESARALQQQLAPRPVYAKHHNHKRNLDSTSIIQQRTSASSPPPYRPESPMALPRRKNTEDDGRGGFCSIRRFVRRAATVPSGTVHHASKRRTVFRRHRQLAIALVLRHSLGPELRGGRSAQRRTSLTSADDDGRRDATVHTSFCRGSARRVVPARSLRSARLVPSPSPLHRTLRRVADLVFLFECWQALAKGTAWARVDVQFIIIVPSPC